MIRKLLILIGLAVLIGLGFVIGVLPGRIDAKMNTIATEPYQVSDAAQKLHDTIGVADLHADTLLWRRNPVKRQSRGHTDFPRLREGGVALQLFTTVTKTPKDLNYDSNDGGSDSIKTLAMVQLWPMRTWNSIYQRAAYQAQRLHKAAARDANFRVITSQQDIAALISDRVSNSSLLGGILGMEGAHPLEGKVENVDRLYDEGFRVMGLQHFFDNELGGSLHGLSGDGLSDFGNQAVLRAIEKGMVLDVAHSSHAVVRDVFALIDKPMIISHTGIASVCETQRNIPDEMLAEIARRGGLIGIGFWEQVTCAPGVEAIAVSIKRGIELFGEDAIALGSDFDGAIIPPFDATGLPRLTDALLKQGLSEDQIRKVMGGNAIEFFAKNLPVE